MPRHQGVFVPHPHCTSAGGDCFTEGRCLRACSAQKRRDQDKRITDLETRVRQLEHALYRRSQEA